MAVDVPDNVQESRSERVVSGDTNLSTAATSSVRGSTPPSRAAARLASVVLARRPPAMRPSRKILHWDMPRAAASIASVIMAAISVRDLDDGVRERLRVRAAQHGRSMEAEIREILTAAVSEPASRADLFTTLLDRFGAVGGIDLPVPPRSSPARAADLSA
jgi:plasmid stability protein